jgi:hypothetical protein
MVEGAKVAVVMVEGCGLVVYDIIVNDCHMWVHLHICIDNAVTGKSFFFSYFIVIDSQRHCNWHISADNIEDI